MQYQPLGNSGLITARLSLGTMLFGEDSARSTPKAAAFQLIDAYLDAGGNHIDTADVYAGGRSESIIGACLKGRRSRVILATKVRFSTSEQQINAEGLSRWNILQGVEKSLKRLQTDYLDLLYLHGFDPLTPLEETLSALHDLIRSGKVRYVGISNFKAWQLMKAQGLSRSLHGQTFIAAQYQYSLVKRDLEYEFFDLLNAEGLGLLPWGPLGGGFLSGKYSQQGPHSGRLASGRLASGRLATTPPENEEAWHRRSTERNWQILAKVQEIALAYDASPSQVALAWILSKKVVSSVLLGPRTYTQLTDNLGANLFTLSADDVAELDRVSQLPELYPYRMIADFGQRNLLKTSSKNNPTP